MFDLKVSRNGLAEDLMVRGNGQRLLQKRALECLHMVKDERFYFRNQVGMLRIRFVFRNETEQKTFKRLNLVLRAVFPNIENDYN